MEEDSSTIETRLGKIERVSFGIGGYQDAMLGVHVTLTGGGSWGVSAEKSAWDHNKIKCSDHARWTEEDRSKQYDEIMRYVSDLLDSANVDSVDQLKGVPVEVTFDGMTLKSWRILSEVL